MDLGRERRRTGPDHTPDGPIRVVVVDSQTFYRAGIVEAIDQPWKFFEGGVGPYWGILDANREPKFSWTGPIVTENYWKLAAIALLVGVVPFG